MNDLLYSVLCLLLFCPLSTQCLLALFLLYMCPICNIVIKYISFIKITSEMNFYSWSEFYGGFGMAFREDLTGHENLAFDVSTFNNYKENKYFCLSLSFL